MLFHVEQCKLIGRNYVKYVILKIHCGANVEVVGTKVFWSCRAELLLAGQRNPRPLKKLSTHKTGIALCHLINLQCVVRQVIAEDKAALTVLPNDGDKFGAEAQNATVVLEELLEVCLRWLRLNRNAVAFRVFVTAPAIVRRQATHLTLLRLSLIVVFWQRLRRKVLYAVLQCGSKKSVQ